jgi:hypothetical protein
MKTPYIKQFSPEGELQNPITPENPYLHKPSFSFKRNKYHILTHPTTGEFIGRIKLKGNNRRNTCIRKGKTSRNRMHM